ncbi:MAG: hypothetical protein J7577_15460 [Sphingobacteriaceae bacterium]|nr:hypothetical protein [Sphingobacteriaceae bacterium]
MIINNLWERLPLPERDRSAYKKDIAEGKVPELPFYIIGQNTFKAIVKSKLENIDSARMVTNLLLADYGNGKTNMLKYLRLFFKTNPAYGIEVQYTRADSERTDLIIFLLKILQDQYLEEIINLIIEKRQSPDNINRFAKDFEGNFREIKKYCEALFNITNTAEEIEEILYLGTGRLSNKRFFDKKGLEQIRDFNRREILAFLLNILSSGSLYIVFAVDEIEKIREKSKIRFNHFLTSYRELVDLFNQIDGHYLMVSGTMGSGEAEIGTANGALYSRIKDDIIQIEPLTSKADIISLITYLNDLFETNKDVNDVFVIYNKKKQESTRYAIQEISKILQTNESTESLVESLERMSLIEEYSLTEKRLEEDEAYKNIHRKFFDPLGYYLGSIGLGEELSRQERIFVDPLNERQLYFIFNSYIEDFSNEVSKILRLKNDNPNLSLIVFAPEKLELTRTRLELTDEDKIEIIDFEPRELLTLMEMYRENYDLQPKIAEIISIYTKEKL